MKRQIMAVVTGCMLGLNAMAYTTTESETLKVWCDNAELTADGKTITKVKFYENDNVMYSAFNMTLNVPKGIKIAQVKSGRQMVNDIELTERATTAHTIACNMLDDGTTIRIISSPTGTLDTYYDDDENGNKMDHLFTLGLIAEPEMADGEYLVTMTGVKFVFPNADACVPKVEPITVTFTIVGGVSTNIDNIEADTSDAGDYYDMMGRKVEGRLLPGIYVHNGRKVMVK